MLEYDRSDVTEGIDVKKTGGLCECIVYHCLQFLNINFRFQPLSADIKKEFDSEPIYSKPSLKIEMLCYGNKPTDFHDKEIVIVGSDYTCLAVITMDSALEKDENYYPQEFLKYIE